MTQTGASTWLYCHRLWWLQPCVLATALHQLLVSFCWHSSPFLLDKFKKICFAFGLVVLLFEFDEFPQVFYWIYLVIGQAKTWFECSGSPFRLDSLTCDLKCQVDSNCHFHFRQADWSSLHPWSEPYWLSDLQVGQCACAVFFPPVSVVCNIWLWTTGIWST